VHDLVEKIRTAIDEDERIAQAAAGHCAQWTASDSGIYPSDGSRHPGPIVTGVYGDLDENYGAHIARHDPARVLRQVAAHRKILEWHHFKTRQTPDGATEYTCGCWWDYDYERWNWLDRVDCDLASELAAIYGIDAPETTAASVRALRADRDSQAD
jgi:hypothetical protein